MGESSTGVDAVSRLASRACAHRSAHGTEGNTMKKTHYGGGEGGGYDYKSATRKAQR